MKKRGNKINRARNLALLLVFAGIGGMYLGLLAKSITWLMIIFMLLGFVMVLSSSALYFIIGMASTKAIVVTCPNCEKPDVYKRQNKDLDDKYAKRVKELQIEVSKEDPLDRRGNSTAKTRVELEVSFNEEKPSRTGLIKNMHLMTHQKISARSKWGAIPMTPDNIQQSADYLELLKTKFKIGDSMYSELKTMLDHWSQGDFSKADKEQDRLLHFLQASRGFSNGLATKNEEELFILNNFGPEYLNTLEETTYTSYKESSQ